MGIDSINLSSSDVAVVALFFVTGFLVATFFTGFFTVGFRVTFIAGICGLIAFFVAFDFADALLEATGITIFVDFGPLPFLPSITICPSWV